QLNLVGAVLNGGNRVVLNAGGNPLSLGPKRANLNRAPVRGGVKVPPPARKRRARVLVDTEGDGNAPLRVLIEHDRVGAVVPPAVLAVRENALDRNGQGVVLGAPEVLNATLGEEVRDRELGRDELGSGRRQHLGLNNVVSHIS